jgi:hypothetical protein
MLHRRAPAKIEERESPPRRAGIDPRDGGCGDGASGGAKMLRRAANTRESSDVIVSLRLAESERHAVGLADGVVFGMLEIRV